MDDHDTAQTATSYTLPALKTLSTGPADAFTASPRHRALQAGKPGLEIADDGTVPKHSGDAELPLTANRTGTWQGCMFHNITAMVGAGVLGLPHTFNYLGWAGGIVVLVVALFVSWYTFILLTLMHEQLASVEEEKSEHPKFIRMNRYIELSNFAFGERWGWIIQPFQIGLLWGTAITYTVTGASCLQAVYENTGGRDMSLSQFVVIFASVHLFLSQVRSFSDLMLVSAMGAITSLIYCVIAFSMSGAFPTEPRSEVSYATGIAYVTREDPITGEVVSITGHKVSDVGVMFGTFNSLTTVMFAFGGHNLALEIQASLPGGTCKEDTTVPRILWGVHTAFVFASCVYFSVACTGWWAYGNMVTSNVIFSLGGPTPVQSFAAMLVVLHVIASFQVYSFPLYDMMEGKLLRFGVHLNWWKRAIIRCSYVVVTAFIACLLPFFGDLMGLVGAIGITPTTYVFPCVLWVVLKRPAMFSFHWWSCWFIIISISCVGTLGAIGSVRQIAMSASKYEVFS